jgi:hypothetical protein
MRDFIVRVPFLEPGSFKPCAVEEIREKRLSARDYSDADPLATEK